MPAYRYTYPRTYLSALTYHTSHLLAWQTHAHPLTYLPIRYNTYNQELSPWPITLLTYLTHIIMESCLTDLLNYQRTYQPTYLVATH